MFNVYAYTYKYIRTRLGIIPVIRLNSMKGYKVFLE